MASEAQVWFSNFSKHFGCMRREEGHWALVQRIFTVGEASMITRSLQATLSE